MIYNQKRDCYADLMAFLHRESNKVCVLYGLRRTGKTVLMQQAAEELKEHVGWILVENGMRMYQIRQQMDQLISEGAVYIFIDEITLAEDFINTASILANKYACAGIKIVLAGTDSLGFYFAENNELYDRAYFIKTTYISYAEHARLLGTSDMDDYIQYGGTLAHEVGLEGRTFVNYKTASRYVDTAIAGNICNSLENFGRGGRFRRLRELQDANQLVKVINKVVELYNGELACQVIQNQFKSHDLGSLRNIAEQRDMTLVMDAEDAQEISRTLSYFLEPGIEITQEVINEIKEYLRCLDLLQENEIRTIDHDKMQNYYEFYISQPGMRYCQAKEFLKLMDEDAYFQTLSMARREQLKNILDEDVKGRILEQVVIRDTKAVLPEAGYEVFKLSLSSGEFDMVVYDRVENCCDIYEIKHSKAMAYNQKKHITNESLVQLAEKFLGKVRNRFVLYRGTSQTDGIVEYVNVNEFLCDIGKRYPKINKDYVCNQGTVRR